MAGRVVLYRDRDDNELSVTPRNVYGNIGPRSIISVVHQAGTTSEVSASVRLIEGEVPGIIFEMVIALNLTPLQIRELIVSLGSILAE